MTYDVCVPAGDGEKRTRRMASSLDLSSAEAHALLQAMMPQKSHATATVAARLAHRSDFSVPPLSDDAARRLAEVFYGDIIATLTFESLGPFRRDIEWHLDLLRRRNIPVTLNDDHTVFAAVKGALCDAFPDHAATILALFADIEPMLELLRQTQCNDIGDGQRA